MSQEINLLPAGAARQGFRPTSAQGLALGVAAAAVLAIGLAVYENYRLHAVERDAQNVEKAVKDARAAHEKAVAQRNAAKAGASADARLAELEAQLQARQQVLEALDSGAVGTTSGFSQYMAALSRQTLAGVWLTAFDFGAGGTQLTLRGRALSPDLVPAYLQRLTQEAPLQGRRFASMVIAQPALAPDPAEAGKGARAVPPYIEFEISSERPQGPAQSAGALPPPLIKPDPPLGTPRPAPASTPDPAK